MFKIIVLCFIGLNLSAYSTAGHTKSDHIRDPLGYKGVEYDHPADVLFKNLGTLNNFTNHPAYLALNNEQQFSAKHYLTSMNYCETGNWAIDRNLKKSSKSCQKIMSIYKELYMRGYSWGYSSGNLSIVDPVFFTMPKIAKLCKDKGLKFAAILNPNARVQPFCNSKGGVTSRNGGLTTVLAVNLPAKNTTSAPAKTSTVKKLSNREQNKIDRKLISQATSASRKGDYLTAKKILNEVIDKSQIDFNIRSAKNQLKIVEGMINITEHHASKKQLNNKTKTTSSSVTRVSKPTSDLSVLMKSQKLSINQKGNHASTSGTKETEKIKQKGAFLATELKLSKREIDQLFSDLILKSKNTIQAIRNNKISFQEAKNILINEINPMTDKVTNAIISPLNHKPNNLDTFNDAVLKNYKYSEKYREVTNTWWEFMNENLPNKTEREKRKAFRNLVKEIIYDKRQVIALASGKYRQHLNTVLDINKFKKDIAANAWDPYGVRRVSEQYFPVLKEVKKDYPDDDDLGYDYMQLSSETAEFMINKSRNSKERFDALPENSEPKKYLRKTIQLIDQQDDVLTAFDKMRDEKIYYMDWYYADWPDSALLALKRANERRRVKFKSLAVLPSVTESSSDRIKYIGNLVIGKTKILDAVNGYVTAVEEAYSRTNYVTSGPYKEKTPYFMGIFEDKLRMNIQSYNNFDDRVEAACIVYDRRGYGKTVDCLFFKDKVLAGYSLNMSSENCKSECTRHQTIIDYFSGMGFKLADESIEGKRIWRKFSLGDKKFNYKLWGGERAYIKKGYTSGVVAKQYAQVCVFDSSIEKILSEQPESKGMWTCR